MFNILVNENITLIVLKNVPGDLCFVTNVLELFAEKNVNIDMISQSPVQGSTASLAITLWDDDLEDAFEIAGNLREIYDGIKVAVSSGNYKVTVSGEEMRNNAGIAAKVFSTAAATNCDIRLITTSETDISLLLTQPDHQTVVDSLEKALN